ncbi:MAG: hypothetical protein CL785_03000 [Chloroflexi bacterium]|nr:hypothetical protein [Chloroflexota bacterium]
MYFLDEPITKSVSESLLITGCARSGTTIMGKLVHSLDKVEYAFEPPFLFSHIPLINHMPHEQWCLLYETYLFEDQHMDAVAGRRLNFNVHDDSNIFNAKERHLIEERVNSSSTRQSILPRALSNTIAYKMPDMLPYIPRLRNYYPDMTIVIMFRRASEVISSLLRKHWFSDESLTNSPSIWPSVVSSKPYVPFWVPLGEIQKWFDLNEIDRCMYYYCLMYEHIHANPKTVIVDYDNFLSDPKEILNKISRLIDRPFGTKSSSILDTVMNQQSPQVLSEIDFGSEEGLHAKKIEQKVISIVNT